MRRKTYEQIVEAIAEAKADGEIYNVDFGELKYEAENIWSFEKGVLMPRQIAHYADLDWLEIPEPVREAYDNISLLQLHHAATRKPYKAKGEMSETVRAEVEAYNAVLERWRPVSQGLRDLKALVVKGRKVIPLTDAKRAEIAADAAARRHCQICGRPILPDESHHLAHHGYERPGIGYQTASCYGARELPFERARDVLGRYIEQQLKPMEQARRETLEAWQKHTGAIVIETKLVQLRRGAINRDFTRRAKPGEVDIPDKVRVIPVDHYDYKRSYKSELYRRENEHRDIAKYLAEQQARYDGWKQTEGL